MGFDALVLVRSHPACSRFLALKPRFHSTTYMPARFPMRSRCSRRIFLPRGTVLPQKRPWHVASNPKKNIELPGRTEKYHKQKDLTPRLSSNLPILVLLSSIYA